MNTSYTRQLLGPINVHRVKSNGLYTIVQYDKDGKRWYSVLNAERVLFTKEIDHFFPFCFHGDYVIWALHYGLFLADPFLVYQSLFVQLDGTVRVPWVGSTGRNLTKVIFQKDPIQDMVIDGQYIVIAFKNYLSWYPLSDEYYGGVSPTLSLEFKDKTLTTVSPLSARFAAYTPINSGVGLNLTREVTASTNNTELEWPNQEGVLLPGSPRLLEPPPRSWGRLYLTYDNHSRGMFFDIPQQKALADFPLPTDRRFTTHYYKHRLYNPWHNFPMFYGEYRETYDLATGIWEQTYFDLKGVWDTRPCVFDLTTDTVYNDGVFERSTGLLNNLPSQIDIIPSNLNLLNHNWLIFYVKVKDENGLPVPFASVKLKVIPGDSPPGETDDATRYFDPDYGGVPEDSDITDIDGIAWLLLRTVDGDFPEQLQGLWGFEVTVTRVLPMTMLDAIAYHGSYEATLQGKIRKLLRETNDLEFLKCRQYFHMEE